MLDLAFPNQFFNSSSHVLNRNVDIDAMLVEKIDAVCAESFQGRLSHFADALGPTVLAFADDTLPKTELRRDHDLIAERLKRLAQKFFIGEWAIGFRRVEE